jgi:hypothetical protein
VVDCRRDREDMGTDSIIIMVQPLVFKGVHADVIPSCGSIYIGITNRSECNCTASKYDQTAGEVEVIGV